MASARRISGSASASRFVACSNCARLLRSRGDVGVIGAEALLVDGQRAAHQRLGLGQPVRVLQQLRQVVEVAGDIGVIGPEALLVDGQRAAHQRLGLGQPVRGLEQLRQVVEVDGDVGVLGAEARLVDGQRAAHQRLGLGQPVRGLEQLRQVVEVGWRRWGARARSSASSMASARRISGSASASRFVAWSNTARLLRSVATLGWSGPKLCSSMASARRISGSASASRLVAWSNCARLLRRDGDVGVVGPEALLVDGQRAAHQRLGLGVHRLCEEQYRELVRQPGGEPDGTSRRGVRDDRFGVGRQRVKNRPGAHVHRIPNKTRLNPPPRFDEKFLPECVALTATGDVLDQPVDAETGYSSRTSRQRVRLQLGQGTDRIGLLIRTPRHGHLEQGFGNGLRGQPGQTLQQAGGAHAELVERGLPSHRHAAVVLHEPRVEPCQHLFTLSLPLRKVLSQADAVSGDVGARLLQGQSEIAQFYGQRSCDTGVVSLLAASVLRASQQEIHRGLGDRTPSDCA